MSKSIKHKVYLVGDQVYIKVFNQVWVLVQDRLRDQVRLQVGTQVGRQVWRQVWNELNKGLVRWENLHDRKNLDRDILRIML